MARCQVCGRGPQFGHNVSHSMRHTKRRWNVNVQRTTVMIGGKPTRKVLCTSCIKSLSKAS